VTFANHGRSIEFSLSPSETVRWDQKLKVSASAAGMKGIAVFQNGRRIGLIERESGSLEVDPKQFGSGPITLQAVAAAGDDVSSRVISPPRAIQIHSSAPLSQLNVPAGKLEPGALLNLASGMKVPVREMKVADWLAKAGVGKRETYQLDAFFEVPASDIYQFQLWHYGQAKLTVDDAPIYRQDAGHYKQQFVPVPLAKGLHHFRLDGKTADNVALKILFGGPGATSLDGARFRHRD
jgi:hypothetical protein